tara:strand:+ start:5507 stop:6706 length:1200 start_codon:yes stop_codon:yes gene_type:complete
MALSDEKLELIDEAFSTDEFIADASLYLNRKEFNLTDEQAEAIVATIYNDEISLAALRVLINDAKGLDDEVIESNPWGDDDFTEGQLSWLEQQGFNFEVVYQKNEDGSLKRDPETGRPIPTNIFGEVTNIFADGFLDIISAGGPAAINALQDSLIAAGIAKEDDFGYEATMSPLMLQHLNTIFNYANEKYWNVIPGHPEYEKIVQSEEFEFPWAADEEIPDIKFSWGMLGKALAEWSIDNEAQERHEAALIHEQYVEDLQRSYKIPSDSAIELTIKEYFKQEAGREPTEKELGKYVNYMGKKYDEQYKDLISLSKAVSNDKIYADYIVGTDTKRSEVKMGGYIPTEQRLDRDVFQTADPQADTLAAIDRETASEQELIQAGKKARERSAELLSFMVSGR